MRRSSMLLVAGLLAAVLAAPGAAMAQAASGPAPEGVGIGDSIYVTGATITPPEGGDTRTFDDYAAAVYVQAWLGCAFFCGAEASVEDIPAGLAVHRVDATGSWNGQEGTVTSYFATDGETAFVAFPGLVVWTDPSQIPPPSQWFIAPVRTIDAFNGNAELEETTGVQSATSVPDTETSPSAPDDSSSSSSSSGLLIAGAVTAVALVGAALWWRRRRGGDEDSVPTEPESVDTAAR